ncbi:MAG: glutathione S-transferase N-terminal domain-containing protein [Reyranella sp.]|uniref:glutathione S-transferase N-terminal domain-containing protein n=1 Tax=Reyranella sp. TaxID=1929291 RepID=UPI0025F7C444|nr:glutathione S-transferase N-terminal domain-containing protein [Reyranella sp.]MBR2815657.1 glutathione S-transferase N-terminal domain-containing protein [Reyranella sp.]
MIDLHYWPTPNGWKISIMLEECGLPYKLVPVNIGAGDQFKPEFLKISPNNRMPAIVDHEPPGGGAPVSVFESGAILQYLAEKAGKFLPKELHARYDVLQWLYWQMGGLGPMAGQAGHFNVYAPQFAPAEQLVYGQKRYSNEVNRLYGVLDKRLADRPFVAGDYSIADMAIWPWVVSYKNFGQTLEDFPNLKRWFAEIGKRPAVVKGQAVGADLRQAPGTQTEEQRKVLFGQTAAVVR